MTHQDGCALPSLHMFKDLGDGSATKCTLTEHIFLAWLGIEIGAGDTGTFLPTIVLLLHEEVEFVEGIGSSAVLLFIVGDGLEQANHRHTTFVLELFHWSDDFLDSIDSSATVVSSTKSGDADIAFAVNSESFAWGDNHVGIVEKAMEEVP